MTTPDNHVVFTAFQNQNWELFLVDADGANRRQLTFDKRYHGYPTICQHGRSAVFFSDSSGVGHLWRLDLGSGSETQLTFGTREVLPYCTSVGEWVYYFDDRATDQFFFKVPASGGNPVRDAFDRTILGYVLPSRDEKYLLGMAKAKDGNPLGVVLEASTARVVNEIPTVGMDFLSWSRDNRYLLCSMRRDGASNIWLLPALNHGEMRQITHLKNGAVTWLDPLYDGKRIAFVHTLDEDNAVLFGLGK